MEPRPVTPPIPNMDYSSLALTVSIGHLMALLSYGQSPSVQSSLSSNQSPRDIRSLLSPYPGIYLVLFVSSMIYLMRRRHTSKNTMTKLIAFANILIFLLATAVSVYSEHIFCRSSAKPLHTADVHPCKICIVPHFWRDWRRLVGYSLGLWPIRCCDHR